MSEDDSDDDFSVDEDFFGDDDLDYEEDQEDEGGVAVEQSGADWDDF